LANLISRWKKRVIEDPVDEEKRAVAKKAFIAAMTVGTGAAAVKLGLINVGSMMNAFDKNPQAAQQKLDSATQAALGITSQYVPYPSLTADPSGAPPGSAWYRSDVGAWRRQNGATGLSERAARGVMPFLTTSPVGISSGYDRNAGADNGPDSAPGGLATTSSGIFENISSLAANGGDVRLLPGTFTTSATIVGSGNGVAVRGAAPYGHPQIMNTSTTTDVFQITGAGWLFEDLVLVAGGTQSAGAGVHLSGNGPYTLERMNINSQWNGIVLDGGAAQFATVIHNVVVANCISTGISIPYSNQVEISDFQILNQSASQPNSVGILAAQASSIMIINGNILNPGQQGILLNPTTSGICSDIRLTGVTIDQAGSHGLALAANGLTSGYLERVYASNCWFSSGSANGVSLTNCAEVQIADCQVVNNAEHGIDFVNNVNDVQIVGCVVSANSSASKGSYHGIYVSQHNFLIVGNRLTQTYINGAEAETQGYGIYLASGAGYGIAYDNDVRFNYTGGIYLGSSDTHMFLQRNPGFNPQGFAISTPGVPSTTNPYASTFPFSVRIYFLTAGTASYTITDPLGNTSSSIPAVAGGYTDLDVGATITPTYATLTWKFYGT
jgi:hypothetical protein